MTIKEASRIRKAWLIATENGAEPVMIDAEPSRRRLQAMAALGWTSARIAEASSIPEMTVKRILQGRHDSVYRRTDNAVRTFYDAFSGTVPHGRPAVRARTLASRNGWAPPLAWDDIDNDTNPADLDYYTGRMNA